MNKQERLKLIIQALVGIWLIIGLAFHLAAVGLIGLTIIIFCTSLCGITSEHALGKAFQESLPFTALLVVFFSVVAVIIDQHLFAPIIHFVLSAAENVQLLLFYVFNGVLSAISDNVFVATVYINEAKAALTAGAISPTNLNCWRLRLTQVPTYHPSPPRTDKRHFYSCLPHL